MHETSLNTKADRSKNVKVWLFQGTLIILLILGIINFGFNVLFLTVVSLVVSFLIELAFAKLRKKPFDKEWLTTPLLIVLILPPGVPIWLAGIATFFAVFFGKNIFGGSGKYIFSPALVGLVFVLISFPVDMATNWISPGGDLFTGVTPLRSLLAGTNPYPYTFLNLLLGQAPGATGETVRIAVLILGVLLMIFNVRDWKVSTSFLGFFVILTVLSFVIFKGAFDRNPLLSLFSGGLLFGAFFIASDPVLAPLTSMGKVVYGFGLALLTFIIRFFGTFPEGVMFAILLMSAVSPLIDNAFPVKDKVESV